MAKCPVCGAPMESRQCGYCGYAEKEERRPASYANNNIPQQAAHEGTRQPQVMITNQYMPPPGIVPGVSRKKGMMLSRMTQGIQGMPGQNTGGKSKAEQLRELKSLLDEGILIREEFNAEKKIIMKQ